MSLYGRSYRPTLLAPDAKMLVEPTVPVQYLNGLGVTAAYNRRLGDIRPFLHYFPSVSFNDPYFYSGKRLSTLQAIQKCQEIVNGTLNDTKRFAKEVIAGKSVYETCKNIYDWLYTYVQYKQDKHGVEQLRRPARTVAESKIGVDCDCFSIFISSCLINLGIPHNFRVIEIEGKGHLQHIYVVVPTSRAKVLEPYNTSAFITIDPVLDTFNAEAHDISSYYDYPMEFTKAYISGLGNTASALDEIYNDLVVQRTSVAQNPQKYLSIGISPRAMVEMLDIAIDKFYTSERDWALAMLAANEDKMYENPAMQGLSGIDGFFQNVAKVVTSTANNVINTVKTTAVNLVNDPVGTIKDIAQTVIDTGKEAAFFLNRKSFLLLVEFNVRALGTKVRDALNDPARRQRVIDIWEKSFGGDYKNLEKAAGIGASRKMLLGLGELTTAAIVGALASAATIIAALAKILGHDDAPAVIAPEGPSASTPGQGILVDGSPIDLNAILKNVSNIPGLQQLLPGNPILPPPQQPAPPVQQPQTPPQQQVYNQPGYNQPVLPGAPQQVVNTPNVYNTPSSGTPATPPPTAPKKNNSLLIGLGIAFVAGTAYVLSQNNNKGGGSVKPAMAGVGKGKKTVTVKLS